MDTVTNPENQIVTRKPSLLTAAMIADNCPDKLADLGKRITVHLEKAAQCDKKADDHRASAGQYLLQAREACDEDGFDAFREKFCPELGRTSVYEMLAIATGKKSVEEVRASSAERSKKYRARKKVELAVRDVTDSEQPIPAPAHQSSWTRSRYPFLSENYPGPEPVEQLPTTLPRRRVDRRLERFDDAISLIQGMADTSCDIAIPPNLTAEKAASHLDRIREAIGNLRKLEAALTAVAQSHEAA